MRRSGTVALIGLLPVLAAAAPPNAAPADERAAAAEFLRASDTKVDRDAFIRAIAASDPRTVLALLAVGYDIGPATAARTQVDVINGLSTACAGTPVPSDRLALVLDAVAEHGFPVGTADARGNTLLLSAAQFCPAPVVGALLKLGAPPDPVNKQDFTPLKMALVSGKWDVVRVLVDAGARITAAESNQLFFEPPQDPEQRALLRRATR